MKTQFLLSTLTEFPHLKDPKGDLLPEIAMAGRSNVGKSSLINHLLGQKKLAKTSATPGKTQLLNFFLIDEKFLFVDLPGYGFAKASPEAIQEWSKAIDGYLNERKALKLLLLLIDSRREVSSEDLSLIEWAAYKKMPLLVVLTKTDKLKRAEIQQKLKQVEQKSLCEVIPYTITENGSRHLLEKRIQKILWG